MIYSERCGRFVQGSGGGGVRQRDCVMIDGVYIVFEDKVRDTRLFCVFTVCVCVFVFKERERERRKRWGRG